MGSGRTRVLAWALGVSGATACIVAAGVVLAFSLPLQFLPIYAFGILMGLLGALIASREPRSSIGWLMIATSLATGLVHLSLGYGYTALIVQHGAWPLGSAAIWLGAWEWVVVLLFVPLISLRFPDGKVQPRWHAVDRLAIAGTAFFAIAIALGRPASVLDFAPITSPMISMLAPYVQSPFGAAVPQGWLSQVQGVGLLLIVVGYVGSAVSVAARFRGASGDEKLQLKWFAYAGALGAITLVYAGVAWNFFGQPLYLALTPLMLAGLTLPVAIATAILRYRLYDIDLIINRSLVYGSTTAVVYAAYVAITTFLERLFISVSGQKSDAAYVLTAFIVVAAFNPIKDWVQRRVNRRLGRPTSSAALEQFRASVDAVVSVLDVHRVAYRFLDQAVAAFDARGAALYLNSGNPSNPVYSRGRFNGDAVIEVALRHEGQQFGRLVLSGRRGNVAYTKQDVAALQLSADSVGAALAVTGQKQP